MTRRVRFSPWLAVGVFAAATASSRPAAAGEVPFVAQPINGAGGLIRLAPADLDGDGDLDVAHIDELADHVGWFENVDGTGGTWTFRSISTALVGPRGVAVADLDRDGDLDVGVASVFDARVTWFENAAGNGSAWVFRTVSTAAPSARTLAAADIDRDGDTDLAYATGGATPGVDFVTWFENPGAGPTWTAHTVATSPVVPNTVAAADVDGDGDQDLFSRSSWHENLAGNGTTWSTHTLPRPSFQIQPVDVDRDGDVDLVQGSATSLPTAVAWLENTAGNGSAWTVRTISSLVDDAINSVSVQDVDGDGDPDVAYAMGFTYGHRVRWLENTGIAAPWVLRTLTTALTRPQSSLLADLDGDGDLDVTAAASNASFTWFRNQTIHESPCFAFALRVISTATSGAQAIVPSDVDGDGDLDAVSTAFLADTVAWHENVGGSGAAWVTRTITTTFNQAFRVTVGDVDRDGDQDVAAVQGTFANSALTWFDNTAGNGTTWTPRTVSTALARGTHVELIDLSGDGDLDLLAAGYYTTPTRWFENAAGNGSAWTPGTLPTGLQTAVATGDLDGDGDPDVASTESFFGDGPGWIENAAGNGSSWTNHTIATPSGVTYGMAAADIDGDGDLDVLQPGLFPLLGVTAWHENVGGAGSAWTQHVIPGSDGSEIGTAHDLDRDGDVDVVQTGNPGGIRWFENTAGNGTAWSGRTVSGAVEPPGGLSVADVDGDGDPDVLSATAISTLLAWHENRAGQASVAVVDQAPPTANNSEVVSMLRATVTHLGRPGDSPLELASLGLRFEESPGDPLTTAEANALVETLRIYRDANGNGVFEPATDVLVTSIGTLALTGGVQVVPFTDGDANVQVTLGTPRDYFVVVELTAAASGQVPNQLRVTLLELGSSASVLEDRNFDIPLRLACPADVASSIKQAVPVELIGFQVE